jgi:hypothetical protein
MSKHLLLAVVVAVEAVVLVVVGAAAAVTVKAATKTQLTQYKIAQLWVFSYFSFYHISFLLQIIQYIECV